MVMATDVLDAGQEGPATMDAVVLQERLVAHVRAVSGEEEPRCSVWGEHSYARGRGAPPGAPVRELLAARARSPPPACLDVLAPPAPQPRPPADHCTDLDDDGDEEEEEEEEDEWEERLVAQAPGAGHARLARDVLGALAELRLERAARAGAAGRWARREGARQLARRLRRALAPHWAGAAPWALSVLPGRLPRRERALWAEALAELRRAAPRLAERLPRAPPPPPDPLDAVAPARDADAPGPWLAWAPGDCGALDERWARRLGALLHTRRLPRAAPHAAPPDRWCAAGAQAARTALAALLHEAGQRPVVLGGCGAGAALAAWLAAGAAAGALLLLAPPLRTAEGARDGPEDLLDDVEPPLLVVAGGGGAACWRGAAAQLAARDACGGGSSDTLSAAPRPPRRVLLLAGADDALRLPRRLRARFALPQQALDAAVAEECARWAAEVTDPARAEAMRARTPHSSPSSEPRAGSDGAGDDARPSPGGNRAIEIVEGRVVSRVTGGSPLALPPPRRAEPPPRRAEPPPRRAEPPPRRAEPPPRRAEPRAAALAAADIMQLPIVFADDEPPLDAPPACAGASGSAAADVTVTSGNPRRVSAGGAIKYTRVIVAKRAAAAAPRAAAPTRRGPGRPPGARAAVLRRRLAD